MKGYKGFTLVELLIVMTILAILMIAAIGVLNPTALVNKANDARRKKDLNRIKIAFEDYFNDKGCFPVWQNTMSDPKIIGIDQLTADSTCTTNINMFSPWLSPWPCDPVTRKPYKITVENKGCPHYFSVYTNLDNKKDVDIPPNWYKYGTAYRVGEDKEITYGTLDVNYGVSSTNRRWYVYQPNEYCGLTSVNYLDHSSDRCYWMVKGDPRFCTGGYCCTDALGAGCSGPMCFAGRCSADCQTDCCGPGCPIIDVNNQ